MLIKLCRISFILLLMSPSFSAMAQKRPVSLNHVAITVQDLAKSTAFYKTIIQLDSIPEPFKDGKHSWFKVGEHSQFHIIEDKRERYTPFKGYHICFSVASIDNFVATLKKANINYEDAVGKPNTVTVRADGVKQVYIQDPDGYWLEINDDPY